MRLLLGVESNMQGVVFRGNFFILNLFGLKACAMLRIG